MWGPLQRADACDLIKDNAYCLRTKCEWHTCLCLRRGRGFGDQRRECGSQANDSRALVSKIDLMEPRLNVEMAAGAYKCDYQRRQDVWPNLSLYHVLAQSNCLRVNLERNKPVEMPLTQCRCRDPSLLAGKD